MKLLIVSMLLFCGLHVEATNRIQVNDQQTLHILCPVAVEYVNVGDFAVVQAEAVPGLSQVVRVKALCAFEGQSSLTIVCQDTLYAFELIFDICAPLELRLIDFKGEAIRNINPSNMPQYQMLERIEEMKMGTVYKAMRKGKYEGIELRLLDIKVEKGLLFMYFSLFNHSNIAYQKEALQFTIRDRKQKKLSNSQQYPIHPMYTDWGETMVEAGQCSFMVLVFHAFSIPDKRELEVLQQEKVVSYQGRNVTLNIKAKDIRQASSFKQLHHATH